MRLPPNRRDLLFHLSLWLVALVCVAMTYHDVYLEISK